MNRNTGDVVRRHSLVVAPRCECNQCTLGDRVSPGRIRTQSTPFQSLLVRDRTSRLVDKFCLVRSTRFPCGWRGCCTHTANRVRPWSFRGRAGCPAYQQAGWIQSFEPPNSCGAVFCCPTFWMYILIAHLRRFFECLCSDGFGIY